jgi:hypothetical protein
LQSRKRVLFHRLSVFFVLTIFTLITSGCITLYDPESSQEWNSDIIGILTPDKQIGQSFVSRRARLNNIQLWLKEASPGSSLDAVLWVRLYHSVQDQLPLASFPVTYQSLARAYPVNIPISPQNDPAGQSYYLALETNGGDINIYGRPEEANPQGNFIVNGKPRETDMAMRLSYDYGTAAFFQDLWKVLQNAWLVIPLLLVLWLPGRLLLETLSHKAMEESFDWGERFALSIGLSLAVIPLALLWTSWLRIPWSRIFVIIGFSLLGVIFLWIIWRKRQGKLIGQNKFLKRPDPISITLFAIFLFTLGTRLIMVRDLATPAWVDPVHHATITRLILENGSYPNNYLPYVDVDNAGYHPGFHGSLAAFIWLSEMRLDEGMLLYGQVLNALIVFSVYLFTTTLTENKKAGLVAALICGVITPMPAYYTSWGRYTQLAGLVILPAAISLIFKSWKSQQKATLSFLAALVCAGLFIVHYRVIVFLAILLISILIGKMLESIGKRDLLRSMPRKISLLFLIIMAALVLSIPQWPNFLASTVVQRISTGQADLQPFADFSWSYLTTAYGRQAIILASLGLALSILRARWFGPVLALWISLLFLIANPMRISFPGAGLVNNTSVEITLFLPIAVLGGYLVGSILETASQFPPQKWKAVYWVLAVGVGVVFAVIGAKKIIPILNPITMLSRQADKPAINWIEENIPQDETILINSFLWGYGFYAGQDGGYWITPISGRKTVPPPMLYPLGNTDTILPINHTCQQLNEAGKNPEQLYTLMDEQQINYLYSGARGGIISPKMLKESELFSLIYAQDGTWIFERKIHTSET